jgi:hypothetical protein
MNRATPPPVFAETANGPVDLAEARRLIASFGCDLAGAVDELEARQVEAWPPVK